MHLAARAKMVDGPTLQNDIALLSLAMIDRSIRRIRRPLVFDGWVSKRSNDPIRARTMNMESDPYAGA